VVRVFQKLFVIYSPTFFFVCSVFSGLNFSLALFFNSSAFFQKPKTPNIISKNQAIPHISPGFSAILVNLAINQRPAIASFHFLATSVTLPNIFFVFSQPLLLDNLSIEESKNFSAESNDSEASTFHFFKDS
jgi:hypothetical protein